MKYTEPHRRRLRGIGWLLRQVACMALVASAPVAAKDVPPRPAGAAVAELQRWYDSTVEDCGDAGRAAYQCSGILMRATSSGAGYLPWDPSDRQLARGSVAFSWLRQNLRFARPHAQNGFILYPPLETPEGKRGDLRILCAFPINAATNARPTHQGCGPMTRYESTTDICQNLGITTAAQWLQRYPEATDFRVCGYELRGMHAARAADWFNIAAQAHQGLDDAAWAINNEVLVSVWGRGQGARMPIHSFFRLPDDPEALARAQYDQIRYHALYQQTLPIVQLHFPEDRRHHLRFGHDEADQAVGRPMPTPFIDFESMPAGPVTRLNINGVPFHVTGDKGEVSQQPHPSSGDLIRGKHLVSDQSMHFVVLGAGKRRVRFSWGCNRVCGITRRIAKQHDLLLEEDTAQMRYGSVEYTVDGPETFELVIDSVETGTQLVIDNLDVRALSAVAPSP